MAVICHKSISYASISTRLRKLVRVVQIGNLFVTVFVSKIQVSEKGGGETMKKLFLFVMLIVLLVSSGFSYVGILYFPNSTVEFDHEPGFQSTIRTFLAEQPLTMFDNLFGTTSYFNDLKDYGKLSQIYKETLKEILLLSSLDPSISLMSSVYEEVKSKGGVVGDTAQAMQAVFEIYRATVDNRYIASDNQYAELLNAMKRFGRMDTKISATWNSVAQKASIASEILKWSKYPLLLNSVRGYMLSMDFAYDRALLTANAVNEYRRTAEVGPLFQNALSDVLREMNTWMDSSSMEQFVNAYIAQINELDLARDITTTVAAKSLKTAVATAKMPVLPAIGWGFAIKFSMDTIVSGISAQDIFNRYLVAGDILHWLRKMRENTPQGTQQHLELAIMELYCQMYAAELGRDFFGERVQEFVVWRSSARREVIDSFANDIKIIESYFDILLENDPIPRQLNSLYATGALPIALPTPIAPSPRDNAEIELEEDQEFVILQWQLTDTELSGLTFSLVAGKSTADVRIEADGLRRAYALLDVEPDVKYYWRVIVKDTAGRESVGPVWSFTTKAPVIAKLPSEIGNMVLVERGEFIMGDTWGVGRSEERPVFGVRFTYDYYIGKYAVTFNEYDRFILDTGWRTPSDSNWGRGQRPVINVSWWDAIAYCNWLSDKEGLPKAYDDKGNFLDGNGKITTDPSRVIGYRLPTEAEWEYAARGGNKSNDYRYSGSNIVGNVAWYEDNSGMKTQEVGRKAPNELGIYDMSGNIWEWCSDWYASYTSSAKTNPYNATPGANRVLRGGSWSFSAAGVRVAFRFGRSPTRADDYDGFRITRTVP